MELNNLIIERPNKQIFKDGDLAIKVFNSDFNKSDILNEALNMARIEETSLNVPKLNGVSVVDGKWAISMDYIEGETLATLMEQHPEKVDEYLELLVEVQMNIHGQTVPLLTNLKDKMRRKMKASFLDATTRYDLETRLESMPKHNKVCHGDLCPSNIILTKDGTAYILDWSHVTQGNASADVARTYLLFKLDGADDMAEKYLRTFCDKSDTARQYVQAWLPIVAASQLVKGKPEEIEFLKRWISVCDYQ